MRTPFHLAPAATCILLMFAGTEGCSAGADPASVRCSGTRECPFGQLCHAVQGVCVAEPQDAVMGTIICEVEDQAQVKAGYTDVIATLQGIRYNLTGASQCLIAPTGYGVPALVVYATQIQFDGQEATATLVLDTTRIVPGQSYGLIDNNTSNPGETVGSGVLLKGQDIIGVYGGGYAVVSGAPQAGATVNIFFEAPLRLPGVTVAGCDDGYTGHSDCGQCMSDAQAPGGCCTQHHDVCNANADCQALIQCGNTCPDDACFSTCMDQHVGGLEAYVSLLTCAVGSSKEGTLGACGAVCQ